MDTFDVEEMSTLECFDLGASLDRVQTDRACDLIFNQLSLSCALSALRQIFFVLLFKFEGGYRVNDVSDDFGRGNWLTVLVDFFLFFVVLLVREFVLFEVCVVGQVLRINEHLVTILSLLHRYVLPIDIDIDTAAALTTSTKVLKDVS